MRLPADTSRWRLLFSIPSTPSLDWLPTRERTQVTLTWSSFCAKTPAHWARITRLLIFYLLQCLRLSPLYFFIYFSSLWLLNIGLSTHRYVSVWDRSSILIKNWVILYLEVSGDFCVSLANGFKWQGSNGNTDVFPHCFYFLSHISAALGFERSKETVNYWIF